MASKEKQSERRGFLKTTAFGAGLAMWAGHTRRSHAKSVTPKKDRLPREVWIATISQNGLRARDHEEMMAKMLRRMDQLTAFEPDVICLPEIFPFVNTDRRASRIEDVAEEAIGPISEPFAAFARQHRCYVVCPIYTTEGGRFYNSAVIIDREGELVGEYRKIHPTTGEIEKGISAGQLTPPVFQTDFGVVGVQICFDIEWTDCWQKLQDAGAEIVFWPSAFAGGAMVNAKAWQHKCCVVSSTNKDSSKICDISGEEVGCTGRWNHSVCASVNLEKTFLHTWPYVRHFHEIHAKYGRKVRITNFAEEEWTIIESRSPDVRVADVMKEFELKTHVEHIQQADAQQCGCRV